MLSPSRAAFSKVRLSQLISKHGNKNFYKGRGGKKFGRPDKWGKFRFNVEQFNRHTFLAPDLEGFNLKPYVARDTPKVTPDYLRNKLLEMYPPAENVEVADQQPQKVASHKKR